MAHEIDPVLTTCLFNYVNEKLGNDGIGDLQACDEVLYHYTTAWGLIGILNSKKIWATDTDYLNDTTENSHGRDLTVEVIEEMTKQTEKDIPLGAHNALLDTTTNFPVNVSIEKHADLALLIALKRSIETFKERDYYVTSFCESGDLLSQWRAYGNFGGGYAIGIKVKKSEFTTLNKHSCYLLKIIYEKKKQKILIKQLVERFIAEFNSYRSQMGREQNLSEQDPQFASIVNTANFVLRSIAIRFKSPGFEEEKEWRIFSTMREDQAPEIEFRDGKGFLCPYIELDVEKLPEIEIVSIYCGPTLHPHLSKRSVEKLLAKHAMRGVEVINSSIPFRL